MVLTMECPKCGNSEHISGYDDFVHEETTPVKKFAYICNVCGEMF